MTQKAIEGEIGTDYDWLIDAHLLLRLHRQELCKRSGPLCGQCPLADDCGFQLGETS